MKIYLLLVSLLLAGSTLQAAPPSPASDWRAAWIAFPGDDGDKTPEPAPLFRKAFTLDTSHGRIVHATAFISGLGCYELEINGQKVGDEVLAPGWTNFAKTCLYDTLDIAPLLHPGVNCAGILLGNGPYNVLNIKNRYTKFAGSFGVEKTIAQINVEFADGTRASFATDATWKAARGPIAFDHQYGGEDYDARLELPHWLEPAFDDSSWQNAVETTAPGDAVLRPALQPPVKVCATFIAKAPAQPKPGIFIYDLGQNMSGWPRLKVTGPAGAVIRMVPGELLDKNGLVSQASSGAPVWFSYTLKGSTRDAVETWEPRFSYYGFRYVQLTGAIPADQALPNAPAQALVHELAGRFVHADLPAGGDFACSNDTLNRIHALINNAILSNAQSILTDCPHREKLGWLEQSHLVGQAIMMNWNVRGLYRKIENDMAEAQTDDGLVPDIAPEFTHFSGGFLDSPEWGSAVVIDPWLVYQNYGDTQILGEHYQAMRKYVAYLGTKATDNILSHGLGDWYDLGPRHPGVAQLTSRDLTATAVYYQDVEILRQTAQLLSHADDATRYGTLAAAIKSAFNQKFFRPDTGRYEKGSQTANAMPLALGLVPDGQEARVLDNLVNAVTANKYRITAGDVGFSYVVRALTDHQRGDVLFAMATHSDGPGYVDQLNKGATTLTEAWDALPSSSQNHLMLGHIEAWFYRGLAGLSPDPAAPGYQHFFLHPQCVSGVDWVTAHHETPFGRIGIHWERGAGGLTFSLDIPPNTTATVTLPGDTQERLLPSGHATLTVPETSAGN